MKSYDIRKRFQSYFTSQGHRLEDSSPLVQKKDPSLLFTNAGMNQFKDYFLGLAPPPYSQVCTIQKCMRAGGKHNDLEQVGFSAYHHTFFEMMGNFSFGAYFKREAIHYAVEFLTKELSLPQDRLWVSVLKQDTESAKIWQKDQNFPSEKIFYLGEKDNFWRMGETGPAGPCTEIYYYDGPQKQASVEDMTEVWNLVFMEFHEYFEGAQRKQKPLSQPAVDTGMGLERLSAVLQGKKSNYHTDLFKGIMESLEKATGLKYDFEQDSEAEHQVAFRVMADHSRALAFLIGDGVLPSSEGAGYVLRRLLRRSLFYGQKLSSAGPKGFASELLCCSAQSVVELMGEVYPALISAKDIIKSTIEKEAQLFLESLREGESVLLKKIKGLSSKKIDDIVVWDLYSTYGFPPDLTRLIAKKKGFIVRDLSTEELKQIFSNRISSPKAFKDKDKEQLIKKMVAIYQQKQADKENLGSSIDLKLRDETLFTGYKTGEDKAQVLLALSIPALCDLSQIQNVSATKSVIAEGERGFVIMDKTCFYPEGGGPVGDTGFLKWSSEANPKEEDNNLPKAKVWDTQKRGNIIIHEVQVLKAQLKVGQVCYMQVDPNRRQLISASHSATHLLHQALKMVLGKGLRQMGSLVQPGQLRFDFNSAPLTAQQLKEIEDKVNGFIQEGNRVLDSTCSYQSAVDKGALFLTGENYPKEVRLVQMGESLEFCGGIHVKNTGDIGGFKIISETGVQSGVRRIVAYVGDVLGKWLQLLAYQNEELREYLNMPLPRWPVDKLKKEQGICHSHSSALREQELYIEKNPFIAIIKKKELEIASLKKQIKKLSSSLGQGKKSGIKDQIRARPFECQGIRALLLTVALPIEDRKLLAETADSMKSQADLPAVVVAIGEGDGRYPIVVTVAGELQKHISAGELLKKHIAPFLKGKGGGQARFAQGMVGDKESFSQLEDFLLTFLDFTDKIK